MATVPLTNRFHTTTEQVPTTNLGSAQANSDRETYSMQDIADTVGTVDYPLFTTDLDTEIQVAPVSMGGVLTPLYYKRFQTLDAVGSTGTLTTYAGIATIIRSNVIVEQELTPGSGSYTHAQANGFSPLESAPIGYIFYEAAKNIIATQTFPKSGAVGAFVGSYRTTFEVWYIA